jgi:hypothetical protein
LIISGSITGIFLSSVMAQRRSLSAQKLFDNTSYVLEYMGRALRMAKKDLIGDCLGSGYEGDNYSTSTHGHVNRANSIRFINYHYKCQEFYLKNDGRIYERVSNSTSGAEADFGNELPLTPSDFIISTSTSKFFVLGASQPPGDILQPRVIIFLEIETEAFKPEAKVKIKIQTTISQRDLDVQEI